MHRSFGILGRAFVAAGCLVGLTGGLSACGGSEEERVPPRLLEASSERVVVDGLATLSSVVTLRFNRPIALSDTLPEGQAAVTFDLTQALAEGFEVPEVSVVSIEAAEASSRLLLVTTAGLVPNGAAVKVDPRALVDGGTASHEIEVESDLTETDVILASQEIGFFDDSRGPAEPVVPTEADRDNNLMRVRLEQHLALRRALGTENTQDSLDLFDAIPHDIVPHAKLRAALAALLGTFAQPAVGSLLTGENCTGQPAALIDFQVPPGSPSLLAEVTFDDKGRRVLSIHPISEGDRFEHIMPLLVHEAVHCEEGNSIAEEVASTAFDTYMYTILVALDPTLVEQNTPLARNLRVDAVVMANSGRLVPESVGVLQSIGVESAVPDGSPAAASFAEYVALAYDTLRFESHGQERTAGEYVNQLIGLTDLSSGSAFDLTYLDALLGKAMPRALMFEAILALDLVPK